MFLKKVSLILATALLAISLTGCGGGDKRKKRKRRQQISRLRSV